MSRLVVVSNRVATSEAAAAGGLAVALTSGLRGEPAMWFGWSGERIARHTGELTTREVDGLEVVTLDLEEGDYDTYYNGYANAALWPLFHSRTDLTNYDHAFAEGYARVNRRFAEALAPLLRPGDLIWVHDYHLIPLGRELRRLGVDNLIGFFLHIPWPARQLFTTLPRHRDLAASMFAYDLVGMQTRECVEAFESYVLHETGGSRDGAWLKAYGERVRIESFPIGLDTANFLELCRSPAAMRACDRMTAHGLFRTLMVGVDRLDYSKGIPERLEGFEQYLHDHPDMVRKVLYLQIAPGSREQVEAYQTLRAQVLAMAGRINANWAEMDHAPVLCVVRNYSRAELAGIYRAAKIGLVTPLRDGMNLVAKEYVAAQDPEDPGVLILSRFAGAAQQMKDALIVNPYSREELADAIGVAIAMPTTERVRRWRALMETVKREDVCAWREDFVLALRQSRQTPDSERPQRAEPRFVPGLIDAPTEGADPRPGAGGSGRGWRTIVQG
ncbi:MAG TPA: trehalose-6-phosphate synthase [Caulobacteraceae bacterium]|jgi:trehalose 6-phosphate synthase|nr:trehalose-6-phosphate synthase [Caulobacteraceae bacterium]